ncbi:hypothetical protein FNV58_01165 (plasmid) [Streptomyces sp. RLB1-9]|uniref:hypothetical protein n=1 Tax=Streptomyces sp. RLB1-9 TaxID=2594454 RepID=UPI0011630B83|nr:hypothetical protein [Streptomyces sp. RLB1-9]QDN94971.1 hypothetical protein FNV58_01165 [Streptomyces sp. RLB1-9]
MQPITMADAADLGVPECFSDEFAFLERTGQLPPYAGPVERDWGSDAYDPYMDDRFEEPVVRLDKFVPVPVAEPEPLKVMPTGRPGHESWCDIDHGSVREHCPPPF